MPGADYAAKKGKRPVIDVPRIVLCYGYVQLGWAIFTAMDVATPPIT